MFALSLFVAELLLSSAEHRSLLSVWFEQTHLIALPAGPIPTLLEDGQCYRGNQLKQGLDGGEVLGLHGKNVQHLKRQDFSSTQIS